MSENPSLYNLFEKVVKLQEKQTTEHRQRLQELDGCFFENFGNNLKRKFETGDRNAAVSEHFEGVSDEEELFLVEPKCSTLENVETTRNIAIQTTVLNIEHLYEEIVFAICHGHTTDIPTEEIYIFIQDVFKFSEERHMEVLKTVSLREPPAMHLNVEIIKAENLLPKDPNGSSDPFVTLYLEFNTVHRYNTSVKQRTLNPKWEEHFSLPLSSIPNGETLKIEVWDFDAAETVREKFNKLCDVKGVRGLRKLMKEIAITASTGKHDNELIGSTAIKLSDISLNGSTIWCNLKKDIRENSRGSLLVGISISGEKNKDVALQEHRQLLKLLLVYELGANEDDPHPWEKNLDARAENVLTHHAIYCGLNSLDCLLSRWVVFANMHEDFPLSLALFNNILNQIAPIVKCLHMKCDEVLSFWNGAKCVLPSCIAIVQDFRGRNINDKHMTADLREVLDFLAIIATLSTPSELNLFPKSLYPWLSQNDSYKYELNEVIASAIATGSQDWLNQIFDIQASFNDSPTMIDEKTLNFLMKLIQTVRSDLQRAMENLDLYFYQSIGFNLSGFLFKFFDPQLSQVIETSLKEISKNLKRLHIPDDDFDFTNYVEVSDMRTTLFELYLMLKRFVELGRSISPDEDFALSSFYLWFTPGVSHWLNISVLKALTRIDKAIQLDKLLMVDDNVKYSSSAIDTLAIFYQVKIFWNQLDWPEFESAFSFLAKIVDDICRCCVFYARKICRRLRQTTGCDDDIFEFSVQWCIAINNIDYITQSLPSFVKELSVEEVMKKMNQRHTQQEYDRCVQTIATVIENALDTQRNQILELIDIATSAMGPTLKRLLEEGAEVLAQNSQAMEKLFLYFESSMKTAYSTLNEPNFQRILDSIWSELTAIVAELIIHNVETRKPPQFFQHLRETIGIMVRYFNPKSTDDSFLLTLGATARLLDLHRSETTSLIHEYYTSKMEEQQNASNSTTGQLTIKAKLTSSKLLLTILNARNLVPLEKSDLCNSFVSVSFSPSELFSNIGSIKTAIQHKTCFPLYDESFVINFSENQLARHDSIIIFSVKEKDIFGLKKKYLGECLITLQAIVDNNEDQIQLNIRKPGYEGSDIIKTLEQRLGDKQAKEFLKKLRSKAT